MTLADVRAAALDRALIADDPRTALALAGAVDAAAEDAADGAFAAAMLAVRVGHGRNRSLDDRAWRPGTDADPLVVAGAAVAVRSRGLSLDRAAALADCAPATVDAALGRRRPADAEE